MAKRGYGSNPWYSWLLTPKNSWQMDVHPKKLWYLIGNLIHPHISSFLDFNGLHFSVAQLATTSPWSPPEIGKQTNVLKSSTTHQILMFALYAYTYTHTQTNKQTDRQTKKQTNKQTNTQTHKHAHTHTHYILHCLALAFYGNKGQPGNAQTSGHTLVARPVFKGVFPKLPWPVLKRQVASIFVAWEQPFGTF